MIKHHHPRRPPWRRAPRVRSERVPRFIVAGRYWPDYDEPDRFEEPDACPVCGDELEWTDCWSCGGEGEFDGYEEDPLWYDEGDMIPCPECNGAGGWRECPNAENHAKIKSDLSAEKKAAP
jgi:hypothetical protein